MRTGIYIHWPFCKAKCPYCDFNSHVRGSIDHGAWREAYLKSLDHYAALLPGRRISSVFFGGGTPSLMEPETVGAILDKIQKLWRIDNDLEVTLEANPTSVEADKFAAFRRAGVNRVSLGVQALDDDVLKFLGREHNAKEALEAIEIARENFERFSFDLMYARPKQTLKEWQEELETALQYAGDHLSLYQLTIEKKTPFYTMALQGAFTMPGEELAADFYNLTQDILEEAGLPAYEVSNHARAGQECRHNLIYWHYDDYIGIGPGAHGRISLPKGDGVKKAVFTPSPFGKHATREHAAPEVWLERAQRQGCGAHPFEALGPEDEFLEALMMGLRLKGGVTLDNLQGRLDEAKLKQAQAQGWLAREGDHITATREGWLRLNALIPYLLQ